MECSMGDEMVKRMEFVLVETLVALKVFFAELCSVAQWAIVKDLG
jgi:hypothetical protein